MLIYRTVAFWCLCSQNHNVITSEARTSFGINCEKWSNNFDNITDNDSVNNTIRDVSEQMLKHRDGTFYESMYLINAKTGKLEGFNTTSNLKLKVALTDKMKAALNNLDLDLIGVHNHPFSSIPSLGDLNAIAKRSNQSMGVIVCHDGTIFTLQINGRNSDR